MKNKTEEEMSCYKRRDKIITRFPLSQAHDERAFERHNMEGEEFRGAHLWLLQPHPQVPAAMIIRLPLQLSLINWQWLSGALSGQVGEATLVWLGKGNVKIQVCHTLNGSGECQHPYHTVCSSWTK